MSIKIHKILGTLFALILVIFAMQANAQSTETNTLIVFDASGSMLELFDGGTRLAAAKGAVFDFLNTQSGNAVGLRMYAHVNHAGDQPGACVETALVTDFTASYDSIKTQITQAQAVGSYTPTAYALTQAAGDFTVGNDNTLILLTDGKETCDGDPAAAAAALRAAGIDVTVHVIGLGVDAETRTELQGIAQAGGGEYFDASDTASLASSFSAIDDGIDKTKIERVTTSVRGGNEIATAVPIAEGEYRLDHHQKEEQYDYFYIDMVPGDEYYIAVGFTLDDVYYDKKTDTFFAPSFTDPDDGKSFGGAGKIHFLSHDGRTEKSLTSILSNSGGSNKEGYAVVNYDGGSSIHITEDHHFESGSDGFGYNAHPLIGNFDRLYFKFGANGIHGMNKDVPLTIKRTTIGGSTDTNDSNFADTEASSNDSSGSTGTNAGSEQGTSGSNTGTSNTNGSGSAGSDSQSPSDDQGRDTDADTGGSAVGSIPPWVWQTAAALSFIVLMIIIIMMALKSRKPEQPVLREQPAPAPSPAPAAPAPAPAPSTPAAPAPEAPAPAAPPAPAATVAPIPAAPQAPAPAPAVDAPPSADGYMSESAAPTPPAPPEA